MSKIVYEFELKNFQAADGYAVIHVVEGRLELDHAPDGATLALIERNGGKLVEIEPDQPPKAKQRGKK